MYGQQHYLEATRLTDGQLLVVCSDKEGKGIEAYGERWQIETLFGSLKSKGFNLEDTHMTAPAKIDRLMSVCWRYWALRWRIYWRSRRMWDEGFFCRVRRLNR